MIRRDEFIIMPEFNSVEEGINYLKDNEIDFSFVVDGKAFTILGDDVDIIDGSIILNINDICISLYDNPLPGQLYIENGFLKYYKENNE